MEPKRLRRLTGFPYDGPNRYFLTICAHQREPLFEHKELVACVVSHILRAATDCGYEITAYCVMPNHVHALVEGDDGCDPLSVFVKRAKQASGFHGRRLIGRPVWQTGFYERVLREWEETRTVVAYILDNPVRKGLVRRAQDYPFSGSGIYTLRELIDFIQVRPT